MGKWTAEHRRKYQETMARKKEEKTQAKRPKRRRKVSLKRKLKMNSLYGKFGVKAIDATSAYPKEVFEEVQRAFEAKELVDKMGWDFARTIYARLSES